MERFRPGYLARRVQGQRPPGADCPGNGVSEAAQRAYEFNCPPAAIKTNGAGALPRVFSFATVDAPNLVVETVKQAEDGDATIIRLYEAYGQRGTARLTVACPIQQASEVNLLEEEMTEEHEERNGLPALSLAADGHSLVFRYTPYEIKTFRVAF